MKFEFSAGGIVYRHDPSTRFAARRASSGQERVLILVAQHSQHHGWVFPKGLIGDKANTSENKKTATTASDAATAETQKKTETQKFSDSAVARETKEEAALREVEEETGVYAKIMKPLTPVTYWYAFGGERIKKIVYYFLMEYVSGDTKDHDFEMENVEWLPIDQVEKRLTYKSDKKIWKEAKEKIRNSNIEIRNGSASSPS